MTTLAFGMPGGTELLIILVVLLLLFGGRKLPELARAMGSSINQFKHGLKEESEDAKKLTPPAADAGEADKKQA